MIELALKAGIPILSCSTSDTLNLEAVISHNAGVACKKWQPSMTTSPKPFDKNSVFYALPNEQPSIITKELYRRLIDDDCVLVLVNRELPCTEALNVGELTVPIELMKSYIEMIVNSDDVETLMKCVKGLTIKQMVEVVRLAQAAYGNTSARSVMSIRSRIIGQSQGLNQVENTNQFYVASPLLKEWLTLNTDYFLNPIDARLVPRGLIFYGDPGVGKTMGAKYLASQLEVPLYRLDLGTSLGKYVGESESNMTRLLAAVDQEEPCVLLIDEIEKVFKDKEDGGVTTRLLAQLLWWLQEHQSRVLVVMTTNNINSLPKELYRAGRIDQSIKMIGLDKSEASDFAYKTIANLLLSFDYEPTSLPIYINQELNGMYSQTSVNSHAAIVELVYYCIKKQKLLIKKD